VVSGGGVPSRVRPTGSRGTAALRHPRFHELMALIDLLRVGRAREVQLAIERLDELLAKAA